VRFFEPPPPPPEPTPFERWEPMPWEGPPDNVLGGVVALELLLARSDMAAVAISSVTAYPTGVEFTVELRLREAPPERLWVGAPWDQRRSQTGELPDELFRLGVQFEDGSKATTLDTGAEGTFVAGGVEVESVGGGGIGVSGEEPERRAPDSPVLVPRGGGGGMRRWSESHWLWPLPPEGRLTFVCEWPALGIALTRIDTDAGPIRTAAARSRTLWDDELEPRHRSAR
jgi:hypothetical protein